MLEFHNVSFSYDGHTPVVDDLNFTVQKGESVGLIGANGAGKSTLMRLMLGLLQGRGEIRVDGLQVQKENLSAIRQKIFTHSRTVDNFFSFKYK